MQVLDVSHNLVPGTLPAQWAQPIGGQRSAFPALQTLAVQGNNLTGAHAGGPKRAALFPALVQAQRRRCLLRRFMEPRASANS